MKVIASSPAPVRANGPDVPRRAPTRAVWGSAIAILVAAVAVVSSSPRDDAEGLLPPAAEQAVARAPGCDRPDAVPAGAEVAGGRIRVDPAASPAELLCVLEGNVRTSDGQGVPNAPVFLVARDHAGRQRTMTGPDGRFELTAGAGRHTLVVPP